MPDSTAQRLVREAIAAAEVRLCFDAYQELRPHLNSPDDLVARWERQRVEGFCIAYIPGPDGRAEAVVGFRVLTTTAWGRVLYVDDLSTRADARRQGLAETLLNHVDDVAKQQGCDSVHLDTGHQRHDAHRLYLRHGYAITSHHLSRPVVRDATSP